MVCLTLRGPLLPLLQSSSRENEGQDSCTEVWALPASGTAGQQSLDQTPAVQTASHPTETRSLLEQDPACSSGAGITPMDCSLGALRSEQLEIKAIPGSSLTQSTSALSTPVPPRQGDPCVPSRRNWARGWHGRSLSAHSANTH